MAMTKINIHDKVTFQLAAADLHSGTLLVRNLCERHRILKDNIVGCAYYTSITRLKSCNVLRARGK